MYRRNMFGKLKKVVMFIRLSEISLFATEAYLSDMNQQCVVPENIPPPPHRKRLWGGTLRDDTKNGCVVDYKSRWVPSGNNIF